MEINLQPFNNINYISTESCILDVKVKFDFPYVLAKYNKAKKLLYKIEDIFPIGHYARNQTIKFFKYIKFSNKDFYNNQNTYNNFTNIQNVEFPKITDLNDTDYHHEFYFAFHEEYFLFFTPYDPPINNYVWKELLTLFLSDNIGCKLLYFNKNRIRGTETNKFRFILKFEDE